MTIPGNHESGMFAAFITGALVGAGVALLLAPQSGAKSREFLRDYAARMKDEIDEALEYGVQALDSAKDRGEEIINTGKKSLREASDQVTGRAERGKKSVQEAKDLAEQHL
jgi:gas vesicle protein